MLFDDLDKKIKEAAEQHHPAYDEKAWQKMEKLLDQHLPQQKDDKRRVIWFALLLLVAGGGGFLLVSKPWIKNPNRELAGGQTKVESTTRGKNQPVPNPGTEQSASPSLPGQTITPDQSLPRPGTTNTETKPLAARTPISKVQNDEQKVSGNNKVNGKTAVPEVTPGNTVKNADMEKNPSPAMNAISAPVNQQRETQSNLSPTPKSGDQQKVSSNQQQGNAAVNKTSTPKTSVGKKSGFMFFASAGPDISKAGSSKAGKTTLAYGAGVGYFFGRFTIRTGVFASKKIYWAGPNDYTLSWNPPPTTKFEGADANCDVLQIPVKLSYAFVDKNKNSFFAGAGLSSYLMKKENYVYTYETSSSTFYYPYETKNENKHYFSILNLSAGYTREISSTVSLTAEPYVDIPLVGIGVGKVRLNSAGVLFSVGVRPFKK